MPDLDVALTSGDLTILLWTAVALGFLHTILGPDHYVPFVMMAKAQKWSRKKTAGITLLCGIGHAGSSILIGVLLVAGGMVVTEWEGSGWAEIQESRGSLAAWGLIGLGVVFFIWGLIRAKRGRPHTHIHKHQDGTIHTHDHSHDHQNEHTHEHKSKIDRITPWILFTIFIFGPCESLIPLMLAAWAVAGFGGTVLVAGAFSGITVLTILGTVGALMMGVSHIPMGKMNKWSTALAGLSLVLCGVAIHWLGL